MGGQAFLIALTFFHQEKFLSVTSSLILNTPGTSQICSLIHEYKALLYIGSLVLAIVYYNQHISPVLRIQWLHLEWELSHQPLDWDAYISHSHINLYLCQYKNYYNQDVLSVMVIILIIIIIVFMYV